MHVRPQVEPIDLAHRVKQVMMIVPVDGDVDEAQNVAQSVAKQLLCFAPVARISDYLLPEFLII